jgi:hypothetical protein
MNHMLIKTLGLSALLLSTSMVDAKGWFGSNSSPWGGKSFFGNNNGYDNNDWPEWTPMYWMEEFFNNDNNDYYPRSYGRYQNAYQNPYQSPAYSTQYMPAPYLGGQYAPRQRLPSYGSMPRQRSYGTRSGFGGLPFSNRGMTSFPSMGGSNFSNPFSSMGGGSPWSSFGGSPLSMGGFGSPMGMGGMPGGFGSPMSPLSPMSMGGMGMPGGFGSPMSPMSMGGMGMPGMSPFGGMGSSPFGGSGFSPFR